MALTFLNSLVPAVCTVWYLFGIRFKQWPITFLLLTTFLQLHLLFVWRVAVSPRLSSLRHLPTASQGPWYKRFLVEPQPNDLEQIMNETPNEGLIRYFGVFNTERVLITKPHGTKEMMLLQAYNFNKLELSRKLVGHVTGDGLIVVNQDVHKRQRKSLTPAFKFKYVKNMFPAFWYHTRQLIENLSIEVDNAESETSKPAIVDVDGWLMRATLDIIAAAGFGVKVNAIRQPDSDLARLLPLANSTSKQATFYRLLAFFVPTTWLYYRLPMARRYEVDAIVKALRDATLPLIQSRRVTLSDHDKINPDKDDEKSEAKAEGFAETDIISTLLRFKEQFSDQELLSQSASILAAGQDTTSVASTWALYLLAHHPQIQAILRDEIRKHLPSPSDSEESVDAALLESLPYLAAVCNETLRLFPPAPVLRREVYKPGTTVLGEVIPVGTVCITSIWGTHRSSKIWGSDVLEFKPERFLQYDSLGKLRFDAHGGLTGETAAYGLIPFGAGPRACIGERFARGEFAALLAGLIGRFEWSLVNPDLKFGQDVEINYGIVTKPQGGILLNAKRQDGW